MNSNRGPSSRVRASTSRLVPWLVLLFAHGGGPAPAFPQQQPSAAELEKLVAPIALYPDALVAQILPASTNPVQVAEAARSIANGGRPTQAQASAWDPSVQALVSFPTVLKMMSAKMDWMTRLGEAVAMDQSGVMGAIQAVRRKAQAAGNLKSNDQQVVINQGAGGGDSTIVIQPANPQVIYVPQYNPALIYQPPPAYYPGYAPAAGLLTFGVGFAAGAATAYACNWGGGGSGSVTVNNNYHYSSTNNYPSTGSTAHYNSATGTYHGYDSKTGTYGAYNPETGKYATYNPSTGAYNKDGETGTYNKSSSSSAYKPKSDVSTGYNAKTGTYGAYDSKTGTYGAYNPKTGKYGTYNPSTGAYDKNGTTGTYDKPHSSSSSSSYHPPSSSDVHQSTDGYRSAYHGGGSEGGSSWGSHSQGYGHEGGGGDAFHGMGGGGWGAREASDRGARSFGGGGFGRGGFGGGFRGRR